MTEIAEKLKTLADTMRKESLAYTRLAALPEGSKPTDATPEQRGMAYSASTYRLCAKMVDDLRKEIE